MKTKKEREILFREELQDLLDRHGAKMEITDDGQPYGMHQGIVVISMDSKRDQNDEYTEEFTEFTL